MEKEGTMEKESTKLSSAQKTAQKKYDEKTKMISVKYTPVDMVDYEKMRSFLDESGQSANQFIKSLIHDYFDPEKKVLSQPESRVTEMNSPVERPVFGLSAGESEGVEDRQEGKRRMGALPQWFD